MHKVSPLAYRYTLEFLKVINDGFGRAVCGRNGTVMENSKVTFPFSNLAPFLWLPWKEQEKVGLQHRVTLPSTTCLPPSRGAATLPLTAQELPSKFSKALKDDVLRSSLTLLFQGFMQRYLQDVGQLAAQETIWFLSSIAIRGVCLHPIHVLCPTFNTVGC